MVIGLLILTSIPTITGVGQAYSAQKTQEERAKDEARMKKFHIDILCDPNSPHARDIHEKRIVLKDDRVWVGPHEAVNPHPQGYVAEAFYIEYPDNDRDPVPLGLVSQTRIDPPLLNWIYVDKDTMEVKYGNKTASIEHHVGPWDWSDDERVIIFDGAAQFTAVQDPKTRRWQFYQDMKEDGLAGYVPKGRRKVQVNLVRTLMPTAP